MDTYTHFKISIPKPCHEDWNKFTPDEKGAFCKVCSKSVYDFTKKKTEEIKKIIVEQVQAGQKVCGRFNPDQLTPGVQPLPPLNPYTLNSSQLKRFALALYFIFGGFLFTTLKSTAQKMGKVACVQPTKGEVEAYHAPVPENDTAAVRIDSIAIPEEKIIPEQFMMGGISAHPILVEETVEDSLPPIPVLGAVAIDVEEQMMGDTIVMENPITEDSSMVVGMIGVSDPIAGEPIAPVDSTYVETRQPKEDLLIDSEPNRIECYPNPSLSGIIALRYVIKKDGMTSISLFDLNGNLVKTLLPMQSLYASSYETRYDVSGLKDGIYFCELISGTNKTTTRIIISK